MMIKPKKTKHPLKLLLTFYSLLSVILGTEVKANFGKTLLDNEIDLLVQARISGTIVDINGIPIEGVTILEKGTHNGTVSGMDGTYSLAANLHSELLFSSLGFTTEIVQINGQQIIDITLKEDFTLLDEVVLNAGYYSVSEKERTGSIVKIDAQTIEKQPVSNPLAAMQGHLSGVNIVQNSGVPGGGFVIDIRGQNFISGVTDPFYIVDGVPYSSQSLGSSEVSGQIFAGNISPLNALNPNDIESIEVLKDADATAIYGSRAANGVVLITTKKGQVGKTRFDAQFSSTLGKVSHYLDLMNTDQYVEIRRDGITNDGFGLFLEDSSFDFIWPDVKSWDNTRYTDWQKELIGGTAYRNNAQLSISGGNATTQFLVSGAVNKETTVFLGDANYLKTTFHSNLNHRSDNDKFHFNLTTSYAHENNQMPRTDLTSLAYSLPPNAPPLLDADGNINWENNTWDNPLAALEEHFVQLSNTLIANALVSYKIMPNLEIKTNLGFNDYRLNTDKTLPSSARNPSLGFTSQNYASLTTNSSQRTSWIVEPQVQWKKDWNELKMDVLVGTTFQQDLTEQFIQSGTGFPNDLLIENLAAASTLEVLQDTDSEYRYTALFGRLNLKLSDTYILNLTGRRDGSSRFGPGKQFGDFGAIGIAWLFSKENWLDESSILSHGKLRGSLGITGSDNIGDYKFLDTYNVTGFDYNGTTLLEPTGIFNPLFGWEENKKIEAALELGFFKDRLLLNTSWYRNRSSNQLIGIPLAATTGFSELTGNFDATVENSGFEMDLRTVNFQKKNFTWSTTFNLTVPKNKLVAFDGLESSTFANSLIIGEPVTIVKLYHALGVDSETGTYQFEDYNGDGLISSLEDKQQLEDFSPKFYGGVGNTFHYRNLTIDLFLQFKKQQAYNELRFGATPGFLGNLSTTLLDRWQEPGDTNPIQRASGGLSFEEDTGALHESSDAAVSDASFIRLRNISINYKIPHTKNGLDLNVYLQGQNIWTWTHYRGPDPEQPSNTSLPQLRQISLGLQIGL